MNKNTESAVLVHLSAEANKLQIEHTRFDLHRMFAHAVELLALAFTHPKSATGWMEKWPLLTRLRESLLNDLGEETFNAAWERGKQLDLETVVGELLDKGSGSQ